MAIIVSSATVDDRAALIELLSAQLAEHDIDISPQRLADAIDGALADPRRGRFWLARRDGRSVGVAYLSFQWALEHGGQSAWLEELYVVPEQRQNGVGSSMLREVMNQARAAGCAAIDLEVEEDHQRAERLYRRIGFRRHQRRRWVFPLNPGTLEP